MHKCLHFKIEALMLYYIFVLIVNFARYILMVTFPESLLRKTEGTLAGTGIMR